MSGRFGQNIQVWMREKCMTNGKRAPEPSELHVNSGRLRVLPPGPPSKTTEKNKNKKRTSAKRQTRNRCQDTRPKRCPPAAGGERRFGERAKKKTTPTVRRINTSDNKQQRSTVAPVASNSEDGSTLSLTEVFSPEEPRQKQRTKINKEKVHGFTEKKKP
jgi:hypothetical protein